ncbi:MAG TPA: hypothetical protein VGR28_13760 [Candidatus Thermoplasmatota archaeon]|nr:hypothetical protein [Candidatus Thermoplasmatota archaeon]
MADPPSVHFTPGERALVARLRTPEQVQRWLHAMPYNWERRGETLRTFRGVVAHGRAHCLEAALSAATILEQHGHPPLLMDLESQDGLDHVLFLFRRDGKWGTVARSRDPGLHGRKPVFRTPRALVESYAAPYVDHTGRITGYGVLDLRALRGDWRLARGDAWFVERALCDNDHASFHMPDAAYARWHRWYARFKERHPRQRPAAYPGRGAWMR